MSTPEWILGLNYPISFIGLNIPAVTFVIACLIILFGCIYGFKDVIKVNRISGQLTKLIDFLKTVKKPIDQDVMDKLHKFFEEQDIALEIKECWEEFKETLLTEKLENNDVIYTNTLQAEQFFKAQFVFHSLPAITKSLPGIVTGMGLLGTFVALLCGLAELHMAEAGGVTGIGPFINALSGKFFSSIFGLMTALTLTFYINTKRKYKLEKTLHELQHQLNVLFPRKSSESILLDLKKELTRIDKAVGHLATDLASKLPEAIKNSVGGDMQSLLDSINGLGQATNALKDVSSTQLNETLQAVLVIKDGVNTLHNQNNDAITESIKGMMEEFKQGLHTSASSEMQQLTQNLGQAAQFLQGFEARSEHEAKRQQAADERLSQLIEAMQVASQNQQHQSKESIEQMTSLLQRVAEQADYLNHQGQQSIQEQMQQLLAQSEQQSREWQHKIQEIFTQTLGQFQSGSQEQVEHLANRSYEMVNRLEVFLTKFDEVGQQSHAQSQESMMAMREQLENSAKAYNDQVREKQSELNSSIEEAITKLSTFMENRENAMQNSYQRLEVTQQALAETLSNGSVELGYAVEGIKDTLNLSKQSMEQLSSSQKVVSNIVDTLQTAQNTVISGLKDSNQTAVAYQQAIQAMQALHEKQTRIYTDLETRLTSILGHININLDQYSIRINEGLSHNLKEWDAQLADASRKFGGIVGEVKDSAEGLADAMDELAKKMPKGDNSKELTNV